MTNLEKIHSSAMESIFGAMFCIFHIIEFRFKDGFDYEAQPNDRYKIGNKVLIQLNWFNPLSIIFVAVTYLFLWGYCLFNGGVKEVKSGYAEFTQEIFNPEYELL